MFEFIDTEFLKDDEIKLVVFEKTDGIEELKYVPRYKFNICLNDDTVIGKIDLRVGHNENTYIGGNIGYEIEEEYRGHHYAAKAVKLIFDLAKRHRLTFVIITCENTNIASNKTIRSVGGRFLELKEVPKTHLMYKAGYRNVNIYEVDL